MDFVPPSQRSRAFREGELARVDRIALTGNPHPHDTQANLDWTLGWQHQSYQLHIAGHDD